MSDYGGETVELRERLQVEALRVWKRHLLSPTDLVTDLMPLIEAERRKRDEHWEGQARDWLRAIDEQGEQLEQSRQREAVVRKLLEENRRAVDVYAEREAEALGLLSEVQEAGPFSPTRLVDGGVVCVWCEHPDAHADDCLIYGIEAFLESQKGGGRPARSNENSSRGLPVTGEAEVSPEARYYLELLADEFAAPEEMARRRALARNFLESS